MKVFLSWSGAASQQIAQALHDWLPLILQPVEPFLTASDIDKGARWAGEIVNNLDQSNFGIACLTKQNLGSLWVAFEAGALSKHLPARLATALFGIGHEDVKPPLGMFQGTLFTHDDFRKLIGSINEALPEDRRRKADQIDTLFETLWPKLEAEINLILQSEAGKAGAAPPVPDLPSMVTELLSLARSQLAILGSPDKFFAPLLERLAKNEELEALLAQRRLASQASMETTKAPI
jgi:TIR domain